jgi:hypothetical protein
VIVEPIEHVVGVVREEVVADDVAAALGVTEVGDVEQVHERVAVVVFGEEAEEFALPHVVAAHQTERPMPDVLELAQHGPAGPHRDVWVLALQRLHARHLVQAHDVFVGRRLVVQAQHIVALGAKAPAGAESTQSVRERLRPRCRQFRLGREDRIVGGAVLEYAGHELRRGGDFRDLRQPALWEGTR